MRYFRYYNTNKNQNNALKAQYKTLTEDEKRTARQKKRWSRFSAVITFAVFILSMGVGIHWIKQISIPPDGFGKY